MLKNVLIQIIYLSVALVHSTSVPKLLLISFDGFRWDYPDIYQLPNFNLLLKRGVRVKHIDNSFATVTFPSHFTIVTGLFEETHGIIANQIYDPISGTSAVPSNMTDSKWWSQNPYTQPIWISNQLANDSFERHSGVIDWPGSNMPVNNHIADKHLGYDYNRPFESALKQVFDWFKGPESTRINFGVIYHPEPDRTGHIYGPISDEMNRTLAECDKYIGKLLEMIDKDEDFKKNLNVIITSDHGMHDINKTHKIFLEKIIDKSLYSAYGPRSFANIFVHDKSHIDSIYAKLSNISNYNVYKKAQIPQEYHYQKNIRIGDILIVGKVGYEIILPGDDDPSDLQGDHGFDNREDSMHPILYGFGPAFHQNFLAEPFRNVDIYPLMSYLLRLNQRETNGSLHNVKHVLNDFSLAFSWQITVVIYLTPVILLAIVYTVCACLHSNKVIYIPPTDGPVQYRLLKMNEDSTINLVLSGSENEEEDEDEIYDKNTNLPS